MIDVLVDAVVADCPGAVHLEPPVTDQELLVKQSSYRAEERILAAPGLAHVKDLRERQRKYLEKNPAEVKMSAKRFVQGKPNVPGIPLQDPHTVRDTVALRN